MTIDFDNYGENEPMEFAYQALYKLKELFPKMKDRDVAYLAKTLLFATANLLPSASQNNEILFYNKAIGHLDAIR